MEYLKWYQEEECLYTKDKKRISVINLESENNDSILDEWATHFRRNYRSLEDLDFERQGTNLSREEFLRDFVFPDKKVGFGPATRVGDFCELLIADYIEFIWEYYVPRTRYCRKINRNSSPQGSDVMGFRIDGKSSLKDEVMIFEVKGTADPNAKKEGYQRLQDAIDDSNKDVARFAESLNAIKMRLRDAGEKDRIPIIERFQNMTDRPYIIKYGASAILTNSKFIADKMVNVTTEEHSYENILLIVIHNKDLNMLIDELFRRAEKC